MHLQEARRVDPAAIDPASGGAAPAALLPAGKGSGAADIALPLAIPFARGFDAFGMGATVVVHLPMADEPADAGLDEVRPVPTALMRPAAPGGRWIVAGLKLLALAVGLCCAYLTVGVLLDVPDGPEPRTSQPLVGPAR